MLYCVMKALIGADLPLTEALPLTSDLWALGMLLSYLFLGVTVFVPEQYVSIASNGQAMCTEEMCGPPLGRWAQSMAHRAQRQDENEKQQEKQLDSTSVVRKLLVNVFAKSIFAISFVVDKAFPVTDHSKEHMNLGDATTLAMVTASSRRSKNHKGAYPWLDALIIEGLERVDVVTSVDEMVKIQVDVLRNAGASKGVYVSSEIESRKGICAECMHPVLQTARSAGHPTASKYSDGNDLESQVPQS
jgi:hypothetical protein